MDAQIAQDIFWIRWLATVILGVLVVWLVAFISLGVMAATRQAHSNAFFDEGNALLNRGEIDKLVSVCETRLRIFPADGAAWWLKANAHYRREEWDEALVCFRKADQLQPGWTLSVAIADIEAKRDKARRAPGLKIVSTPTPEGPRNDNDA